MVNTNKHAMLVCEGLRILLKYDDYADLIAENGRVRVVGFKDKLDPKNISQEDRDTLKELLWEHMELFNHTGYWFISNNIGTT